MFSKIEGPFTAIATTNSISSAPAQGSDAWLTAGLERVNGLCQRRQHDVRPHCAADPMRARGITGVAGRTAPPDFADFNAIGWPHAP